MSKNEDPHADVVTISNSGLIDEIADWLMSQGLGETNVPDLFEQCCLRLRAAGLPIWRALLTYPTLHPLYASMWLTWRRDEGVGITESLIGYTSIDQDFLESPFHHMTKTRIPFLRRRLIGDEAIADFPVLRTFRDQGATDYLAFLVPFGDNAYSNSMINGIMTSWSTDRESGFSRDDIQSLQRIQNRLGVVSRVMIERQIAANALAAYLGVDAGQKVLDGQIKRGDGENINAAIWYSDLRGSTRLADNMSSEDYLKLLNMYFECTAGAVIANGGEVLRFIGDAVLAIFPIRNDADVTKACASAVAAARDAQTKVERFNQEESLLTDNPISFGLGLHKGYIMYGNIGVP
ncbi:MAG: adenylate/guanylate cyclase domain-containing protein, partial [bacterium]